MILKDMMKKGSEEPEEGVPAPGESEGTEGTPPQGEKSGLIGNILKGGKKEVTEEDIAAAVITPVPPEQKLPPKESRTARRQTGRHLAGSANGHLFIQPSSPRYLGFDHLCRHSVGVQTGHGVGPV